MTLDATDRSILEALGLDSRKSHRQLARELGVAQGTVTNRIRRLEERGVIQGYGVRVDPEQVGWSMTIIAGLRIAKGAMLRVQREIAQDPRVQAVYDVTGEYDSLVMARVRDRSDLNDLTKTVFTLEGIERSFTRVVLNTVKEGPVQIP